MIFPRREDATNNELILTIIAIQGWLSRYGDTHTNWHETLNEVRARLENTRWTPVSEGLPEPWESVLITFSGKYGNLTADHAVGLGSWDGTDGWYFEEIEGYTDWLTVEAWMNLPESYKGE